LLGALITKEPFLSHISILPFSLLSDFIIRNFPEHTAPLVFFGKMSALRTAQSLCIWFDRHRAENTAIDSLQVEGAFSSPASVCEPDTMSRASRIESSSNTGNKRPGACCVPSSKSGNLSGPHVQKTRLWTQILSKPPSSFYIQ
jgi:hypothetical protein